MANFVSRSAMIEGVICKKRIDFFHSIKPAPTSDLSWKAFSPETGSLIAKSADHLCIQPQARKLVPDGASFQKHFSLDCKSLQCLTSTRLDLRRKESIRPVWNIGTECSHHPQAA